MSGYVVVLDGPARQFRSRVSYEYEVHGPDMTCEDLGSFRSLARAIDAARDWARSQIDCRTEACDWELDRVSTRESNRFWIDGATSHVEWTPVARGEEGTSAASAAPAADAPAAPSMRRSAAAGGDIRDADSTAPGDTTTGAPQRGAH